ncbi:hypothetical protein HK22_02030 [Gluconobacter sp. DsW_056]|nr:hypothetical protein HK22_02030 [Gluconobacter sp. DsW_056]
MRWDMAKKTYSLGSSAAAYTPGIIAWAKNGYAFEEDRAGMRQVLAKAYGIPEDAAHKLLSGEVEHRIEDDVVVFEVEEGD